MRSVQLKRKIYKEKEKESPAEEFDYDVQSRKISDSPFGSDEAAEIEAN